MGRRTKSIVDWSNLGLKLIALATHQFTGLANGGGPISAPIQISVPPGGAP
jgi:hypothetical protein